MGKDFSNTAPQPPFVWDGGIPICLLFLICEGRWVPHLRQEGYLNIWCHHIFPKKGLSTAEVTGTGDDNKSEFQSL